MILDTLIKASKQKQEQISQELPYLYYDDENGLFCNKTSIGFGLLLLPLGGCDETTIVDLNNLLCTLPEGENWDYQVTMRSTNRVGRSIRDNLEASSRYDGISRTLAENQAVYAEYAARQGFNSNYRSVKFDLREYQVSIFVSSTKGDLKKLAELQSQLKTSFTQLGMAFKPYDSEMLIGKVRTALNFDRETLLDESFEYNDLEEIYKQCLSNTSEYFHHEDSVEYRYTNDDAEIREGRIATFGLQRLPTEFRLYRLSNCFADIIEASRVINCPFEFSTSFRVLNSGSETLANDSRIRTCEKWLDSPMGKLLPNLADELEERKLLRQGLASSECKTAQMLMTLVIYSDKENLKRDIHAAQSALRNESLRIIPNNIIHAPCFLSTLPFMNSDGFFNDLNRLGLVRKVKTSNLVNFLPFVVDPYCNGIGVLLPTFRRSMFFLDPFTAGGDNFNMAVSASSGSGKSFLIQAITKSITERGGVAFILDNGDSYKKFTLMNNGVYMNYRDIQLNPFTHLKEIEKGENFIDEKTGEEVNPLRTVINDIVNLFCIICSPEKPIYGAPKIAILNAIDESYRKYGTKTIVDNIADELKKIAEERNDKEISDLAYALTPYCEGNIFGDVFNKPSKLAPNVRVTTLELSGFKGDLLPPVVFALIVNINQAMYLSGDRTQKKICVIEEAWKLMSGKNEATAEFIEEGYRTARKFKGCFCTVTQGVRDYFKSSGAEAAYNNSDVHIYLRQGDTFDDYIKENPNAFSPYEVRMIKAFKTAKEAGFSSLMLRVSGKTSFHRFFCDPLSRAMLSTEADEFQFFEDQLESGLSAYDAVMNTAKRFYPEDINLFEKIKKESRFN